MAEFADLDKRLAEKLEERRHYLSGRKITLLLAHGYRVEDCEYYGGDDGEAVFVLPDNAKLHVVVSQIVAIIAQRSQEEVNKEQDNG